MTKINKMSKSLCQFIKLNGVFLEKKILDEKNYELVKEVWIGTGKF